MDLGNRILILGSPCSGKSTLAFELGRLSGLPVIHLDNIYLKYQQNCSWDMMNTEIQIIADQPAWIMDGNYSGTLNFRAVRADTIIHLEISRYLCLLRLFLRSFKKDSSSGCPRKIKRELMQKIWKYSYEPYVNAMACISEIDADQIRYNLKGQKAIGNFLKEVKNHNIARV